MNAFASVREALLWLLDRKYASEHPFTVVEVRPGTARFDVGVRHLSDAAHDDFDVLQRKHDRGRWGMLAVLGGRGDYGTILWLNDYGGLPVRVWVGLS